MRCTSSKDGWSATPLRRPQRARSGHNRTLFMARHGCCRYLRVPIFDRTARHGTRQCIAVLSMYTQKKLHRTFVAGGRAKRRRDVDERWKRGQRWFGVLRAALAEDEAARGVPPDLDENEVLRWADAFFAHSGHWPTPLAGPIPEAPDETWLLIEAALSFGRRGFAFGGTLARFFAEHRGRYHLQEPDFSVEQILVWADEWHAANEEWPTGTSGPVPGGGGVTWLALDLALKLGRGGLPGGSTLARLLAEERGVFLHKRLSDEQILEWADAHHARTGRWPSVTSGPMIEAPDESWIALNNALEGGYRGLPGGSSLARLLVERRESRSNAHLPPLEIPRILRWADAFHRQTGRWPTIHSGPIAAAPGETWRGINASLVAGYRGVGPGSSLVRLLAKERSVHSKGHRPPLEIPDILRWANAHRARHDRWPSANSGRIPEAPGETWNAVSRALYSGTRGLPGGMTIPQLLRRDRDAPQHEQAAPLTIQGIVAWAHAHRGRTGKWPNVSSGAIPESPGDTWRQIEYALDHGVRGLRGGWSLVKLFARRRGKRPDVAAPHLNVPEILAWADAFHAREGRWPGCGSGELPEATGETWMRVNAALRQGRRGLPGGSSLARLLAERKGKRSWSPLPELTIPQVLAWADAHHARTGRWPTSASGLISDSGGLYWINVDNFLKRKTGGARKGELSLYRLLSRERGIVRHPPLTEGQVLLWADAFYAREGQWPAIRSGPIPEAPDETWAAVHMALLIGGRGFAGGSSLAKLLFERRGATVRRRATGRSARLKQATAHRPGALSRAPISGARVPESH